MTPETLLHELAPVAEAMFERHRAATREWFPHEYVPYDRARVFEPGYRWTEADSAIALDPAMRSALFVNLLTEDNLPYYFRDVDIALGRGGEIWTEWVRWWTAEEGRHSIVMRDYLTVTRAIDPVALERGRMIQISGGEAPAPASSHHALVYLTLQELATRISHRNTGKLINDEAGYQVMARVAFDENLHFLFYRDCAGAALEADPSAMVIAMEQIVRTFAMPGTGIPDFPVHAAAIARAGIYDLAIHHDQILVPVVLRHWGVAELTGLSDEAERARDHLLRRIERTGRVAARLAERRQEADAGAMATST